MKKLLFFPLLVCLFISSCKKDNSLSYEEQLAKDVALIKQYLADKNLVALSTASGLHYIIEVEGTGGHPTIDNTVTVHYKGYFLDGQVFDQTQAEPISFPLRNVIVGWQEGIPLFKKGGKGKLFLPSGLAYGNNPPQGIPNGAIMAFDVELVDF